MSDKDARADADTPDLQQELDRDPGISDSEGLIGRTAEENAEVTREQGASEKDK